VIDWKHLIDNLCCGLVVKLAGPLLRQVNSALLSLAIPAVPSMDCSFT